MGHSANRGYQPRAVHDGWQRQVHRCGFPAEAFNVGGQVARGRNVQPRVAARAEQKPDLDILNNLDGIDLALDREAAAKRFRLMGSRIGDIMVLGAADVGFGDPAEVTIPGSLRSHGSLYEEMVPVIGCGGNFDGFDFLENKDLGRYVFERVLP